MPKAAPPEDRQNAIRLATEIGVTKAAEQTGYGKGTVSRWCSEAGVVTVPCEQTRKAVEAVQLNATERKARLSDRLLEIAEMGTAQTLDMLAEANLHDLVGAWGRALHYAQLLTGGPTQSIQNLRSVEEAVDELTQRRKLKSVA